MDTFEMLKRLLSQNEFELLLPDQTGAKEKNTDKTDIRLVYQMNDTIESFLVFKEARMTGTYKEDYEGAIEASFYRDGADVGIRSPYCFLSAAFLSASSAFFSMSGRKRRIVLSLSFLKRWSWKQICIIMVILRIFGEKVMKICGNWNFVLRYYGINMSILVRLSAMRKNENSCS